MPAVAPVPFAPFWGHDDDADPLAGGALYAFAAGTDTPLTTYANPQGTTLNQHPVTLDDAGYANVYLHAGTPYKLRLVNNLGVQQWEIDQVYGAGAGGGSGLAGVGWGKNTMAITPTNGASQASAAVFPPDVLALGLTVWVQTAFGASQGLQQIGLGTPTLPEAWGVLDQVALDAASSAGMFLAYSGQPKPESGVVTLTAYGGLFDGTGTLYATGHFFTLTPGHALGYSYVPGVPETGQILPPQPPATETARGLVELIDATEVLAETDLTRALTIGRLVSRTSTEGRGGLTRYGTPTETTTGTLTTVATHPAGVKAALDARVPAGTGLSVTRYTASGSAVEATPGLSTTSDGRLGVGATPETNYAVQVQGNVRVRQTFLSVLQESLQLTLNPILYSATTSHIVSCAAQRAGGTEALPAATAANQVFLRLLGKGHDGATFPSSARTWIDLLGTETWTPTAQGSAMSFNTTLTGTVTQAERLRIHGNGYVGVATAAPQFPLHVAGALAYAVPTAEPASAGLSNGQMVWWLNETDNTLRGLIKKSDGSIRRVSIATTA